MTNTPAFDPWLADFAARHDLPKVLADNEDLANARTELAAAYVAEHLPARYANAYPATQELQAWTAEVVRTAYARSVELGHRAVTIHEGPSLLILGSTGVGKTHETYGAMRAISGLGLHAQWLVITAADMYGRLRPRHGIDSEAEFKAIYDAPLLVVDDLGAAKNSEWVEDVNTRLINRRYNTMRPTLFTSNVPPRELAAVLGDRIASRLEEMTTRVVIKGTDLRRVA